MKVRFVILNGSTDPDTFDSNSVPRIGELVQFSTRAGTLQHVVVDVQWLIGSSYGEPTCQIILLGIGRGDPKEREVEIRDLEDVPDDELLASYRTLLATGRSFAGLVADELRKRGIEIPE